MGLRTVFSVLAWFAILFAVNSGAQTGARSVQPTPEQLARIPVEALPVADFKLLSANTGWVSTGDRLLWTTDNGAHWKDISPPNPNDDNYASVFFLNPEAGWVLFVHQIQDDERPEQATDELSSDWTFMLSFTVNGGSSWTVAKIPALQSKPGANLDGVGDIAFADKLHGWMNLHHSMTWGGLLATSDGGRTWNWVNEAPEIPGTLFALSNADLLLAGDSELYATHNGGKSFQEISLIAPLEIAPASEPTYGRPVFNDSVRGYETVTYSGGNGKKSAAVLFSTEDGGRTWKPDRILSNLAESSVGQKVSSTVAGTTWIIPFAAKGQMPTLMKLLPSSRAIAGPHKNGDFARCSISFLTPDEGWMNCSGALSSTIDGGPTWTTITPRARNGILTTEPITELPRQIPLRTHETKIAVSKTRATAASTSFGGGLSSGISQHLGFETRRVPSMADMQTWWDSSPYYEVGVYTPGSPNRGHDVNLTSDWVEAVTAQGWGIIPIWFGLQAPCARAHFRSTFSATPNEATQQGIEQATEAYTSVTAIGLDGTIIYVDLEDFNHSTCGVAAQAYLSGFVQQMHTQGGSVGVYGGQYNATQDFQFASPMPDDVWIARKDGHVTVWGLGHGLSPALPDTLWPAKQRIHQYWIDQDETWRGTTIHVDSDIVDATIVPSSGMKYFDYLPQYLSTVSLGTGQVGWSQFTAINNGQFVGGKFQRGTAIGFAQEIPPNAPDPGESSYWTSYVVSADRRQTQPSHRPGPAVLYSEFELQGINNLGQSVGFYDNYQDENGCPLVGCGVFYKSQTSKPILLNYGSQGTELTSINDAGWIVGTYWNDDPSDQGTHCVLYKPDAEGKYSNPIPFDPPGGAGGQCTGINGIGQIVGFGAAGAAFVDDAESGDPANPQNFQTLPSPPSSSAFDSFVPNSINNNGLVVGNDYGGDGFLFIPPLTDIDLTLLGPGNPYGINDEVQIVGGNGLQGVSLDTPH